MKGFPGLYKRGRLYHFAIQRDGKRVFYALETDDLQEAIRKAELIRGSPIISKDPVLADVERFLAWKLERGHYTAASVDSKGAILRQFAEHIRGHAAHTVTPAMIKAWQEDLGKPYRKVYTAKGQPPREGAIRQRSASTINGYLMVVRSFFEWSVAVRKSARENPVAKLELSRGTGGARKDFCTPEVRDALITNCMREDLRFVLFCGFHAGMRFQEIVEAKAFWFDLKSRQIHLRKHAGIQFKDREERSVPMTEPFRAFLEGYGLREPYMLHPEVTKGKSLYRYDFDKPFRQYVRAQGFPKVTAHVMRHTFASILASRGVSIYLIAEWLGDDVRVVQKHYARLLPAHDMIARML